jgi:nicotinate-nucleotide--dimethylbenzimidazole phosphoribosyltransferase
VGAGAVSHVGTGHPPRPPIAMRPLDEGAMTAARARQAQLVKPPGSLGRLEDLAVWLAGATGSERPALHARVVVAAADHGVAAQGVSAYPQAVTAQMLATFASGRGAVSTLAGAVGADLVLVDAGVAGGSEGIDCVRLGLAASRDLSVQPALEVAEVALAVDAGRDLAARAAADGITVLAGGEMGIANTTPATCLAALLTGRAVADLVGPGTGLDDAGVARKRAVCERALALHADAARGPLHALRRVGGGEIALLCGLALGAGEHGLGYVCDGLIATAAAAVAVGIEADLRPRLLAGHRSPEPAHGALLDHLGLKPVLDLGMRLGEGSGATAALAVLRLALAAHDGMATFAEAGVSGAA